MNESSITREVMTLIRGYPCVLIKHCDRFTKGVPDSSLTIHQLTIWFEIKFVKQGKELHVLCGANMPQLLTMCRLETHGIALYLAFLSHDTGTFLQAWRPHDILQTIQGHRASPLRSALWPEPGGRKLLVEVLNLENNQVFNPGR